MAVDTPSRSPGGAAVLDKQTERVRKTSPRYKVLLHNDPVNSMEYVVVTLQQVVPQLSEQDAMAVMLETHNTGVGLVIVCDIEPAEFYCETLKARDSPALSNRKSDAAPPQIVVALVGNTFLRTGALWHWLAERTTTGDHPSAVAARPGEPGGSRAGAAATAAHPPLALASELGCRASLGKAWDCLPRN